MGKYFRVVFVRLESGSIVLLGERDWEGRGDDLVINF